MSNCEFTISIYDFLQRFPDEISAFDYLEARRWGKVVVCPLCDSDRTTRQKDPRYHQCKACRRKFTVRTGTIFARSHIPLNKWLYVMYLTQLSRKGISSLQLSKEIGITQKSAWFMLHRIRDVCSSNGDPLYGIVEVDETYIGGKEKNKHESKKIHAGRGPVGKTAVLGIRQRNGHVVATPIQYTDKDTLQGFIAANVEQGSTVYTDEHKSYIGLQGTFEHGTVNHSAKEYVNGMAHTNGIESVWALLKRGYHGIYHHMSPKHLHRYVNEFVGRHNTRGLNTVEQMKVIAGDLVNKQLRYQDLVSENV